MPTVIGPELKIKTSARRFDTNQLEVNEKSKAFTALLKNESRFESGVLTTVTLIPSTSILFINPSILWISLL